MWIYFISIFLKSSFDILSDDDVVLSVVPLALLCDIFLGTSVVVGLDELFVFDFWTLRGTMPTRVRAFPLLQNTK